MRRNNTLKKCKPEVSNPATTNFPAVDFLSLGFPVLKVDFAFLAILLVSHGKKHICHRAA
jgi:hypothetical protein